MPPPAFTLEALSTNCRAAGRCCGRPAARRTRSSRSCDSGVSMRTKASKAKAKARHLGSGMRLRELARSASSVSSKARHAASSWSRSTAINARVAAAALRIPGASGGKEANTSVASSKRPCRTRTKAMSGAWRNGVSDSVRQALMTASAGAAVSTTWFKQPSRALSRSASGSDSSRSSASGSARKRQSDTAFGSMNTASTKSMSPETMAVRSAMSSSAGSYHGPERSERKASTNAARQPISWARRVSGRIQASTAHRPPSAASTTTFAASSSA